MDADLVVEVLKDSFSHSLVLNDRPEVSEPVELRLPLDAGEGEVAADDLSCTGLVTLALVRLVVSEGVEDCGGLGWDFWGEGDVVSVDVAGELA